MLTNSVKPTTWLQFERINQAVGLEVVFASETEQVTHSFKYRAATSVVQNIDAAGFLAASSGNFGQALACACQRKGVPCIIVMPTTSAKVKIEAVRSYGAKVVFVDTRLQSRADKVTEVARTYPTYHIASAYDCRWVIAGNASLGHEIAQSSWQPEAVLVPVGGGGLIAGIARAFEQRHYTVPLWGVEPAMADDAARSLEQGVRLCNQGEPQTLADGARTQSVGVLNWPIIQRRVQQITRVSESSICQAMRLFHAVGLKVEPTGALTLASLIEHRCPLNRVIAVISGQNVDAGLYEQIIASKGTIST